MKKLLVFVIGSGVVFGCSSVVEEATPSKMIPPIEVQKKIEDTNAVSQPTKKIIPNEPSLLDLESEQDRLFLEAEEYDDRLFELELMQLPIGTKRADPESAVNNYDTQLTDSLKEEALIEKEFDSIINLDF